MPPASVRWVLLELDEPRQYRMRRVGQRSYAGAKWEGSSGAVKMKNTQCVFEKEMQAYLDHSSKLSSSKARQTLFLHTWEDQLAGTRVRLAG